MLAVPVPAIRRATQAIKPWLGRHTVVLDVANVRIKPTDILRDVYGTKLPGCPAHPLFGQPSLADFEQPRRVVRCAADTPQVAAAAAVRDLFERLGCVVVDLEAQTHDRKVADLHALAFFVARGTVEPGNNVDEPVSSSSFQAMATTVRTPSDLQ